MLPRADATAKESMSQFTSSRTVLGGRLGVSERIYSVGARTNHRTVLEMGILGLMSGDLYHSAGFSSHRPGSIRNHYCAARTRHGRSARAAAGGLPLHLGAEKLSIVV